MKYINLTKGYRTIIDDEDFDYLNQWLWSVSLGEKRKTPYALNNTIFELMHVLIIKHHNLYIVDMFADHIDRDGLNNQKYNLRMVTKSQNGANSGLRINNKSGYKGVSWYSGAWHAEIMINYEKKHLGGFTSKHDAAYVYNCWAKHYFGEYAFLNEINRED